MSRGAARSGFAVATVDLAALRANFAEARRLAAGAEVIAVVKADAYGHGAVPVARALARDGCPRLATWSVDEAVGLRDASVSPPILILAGVQSAEEARAAVEADLVPVVHDEAGLQRLAEAVRRGASDPLDVHVEIDTGMHRMGVAPGDAMDLVERVHGAPELRLDGVMTHFARADEADLDATRDQLVRFSRILAELQERGVSPGRVHVANSAGLVAWSELEGCGVAPDAVRPGLMLYGAQPSSTRAVPLRPVMSLRAPVVAIRSLRAGDPVGYGARYRAPRDTRIATLGLGYADGLPIALTNRGAVWLAGARRPIAGRVSMDSVGVDIGDAAVAVGDRAVVFGATEAEAAAVLPVDEVADHAGTLSYELLVRVGQRVPREYVGAATEV